MKVVHRGRIVDENGSPLWGANILTLNSDPRRGSASDVNGNFGVDGYVGETFQITYLGFKPQTFTLRQVNVDKTYRLVESAEQLDEVVVTPRTQVPVKKDRNPFDFGGLLRNVGNIFTGATKELATPSFNPNSLTTTGQQGLIRRPDEPKTGLLNWINNNPALAGGLFLALLAGGGYALSKNEKKPTPKKK